MNASATELANWFLKPDRYDFQTVTSGQMAARVPTPAEPVWGSSNLLGGSGFSAWLGSDHGTILRPTGDNKDQSTGGFFADLARRSELLGDIGALKQIQAGTSVSDAGGLRREIKARLAGPVKAVLAIMQRWKMPDDVGARLLGSERPGFIGDLRAGIAGFETRDVQDRARMLLDIYEGVHALLLQVEAERAWLAVARDALGDRSVLDLMTEGSQLNLYRAKSFVDYVNGR